MINDPSAIAILKEYYHLTVKRQQIIRESTKSVVIKCETDMGTYILKRDTTTIEKLQFILAATEYLRNLNIQIPKTIPTVHRQNYIILQDQLFYLQEWIPSSSPSVSTMEDLIQITKQVGMVHQLSIEYKPPQAHLFLKENNWDQNMRRVLLYLIGIRYITPKTEPIDFFITKGDLVITKLKDITAFHTLKNIPLQEHCLCHNDIHVENILKMDSKLYLIDWNLAKYDIPAKDVNGLMKLMIHVKDTWDISLFESILHTYTKENPLSEKLLPLIFLYLAFPHNAFEIMVKHLQKRITDEQFATLLQIEKEKTEYLLTQLTMYI